MLSAIGFLGDLHPVAVHFPIALLPTILLLKLVGWRRPRPWIEPACGVLLLLTLGFCVLAALLGWLNRLTNGHSGDDVDLHAWLGVATTLAVALAASLHYRADAIKALLSDAGLRLRPLGSAIGQALGVVLSILKWVLLILLFPLVLSWWVLRWAWRRTLAVRAAPLLDAAGGRARALLAGIRERAANGIRQLAPTPANGVLAAGLLLVLLTGLKGANLGHGEGHLTRNMPAPLAALFGANDTLEQNRQLDRAFFDSHLAPAFRRSCVKCHGGEKQRAGLRLDSYEALIASPAVRWQDPYGSELVKRILLPADDPGVMPPAGKSRPVHTDDVGAIIAWLQGHSLESIASQSGGLPQDLRQLAASLDPLDDTELAALNGIEGLRIRRLVEDHDLLVVNLSFVPEARQREALTALMPHRRHIIDLDWSGRALPAPAWEFVAGLANLRRLNLSRSTVNDRNLATLSRLQALRWLNLTGTSVAMSDTEIQGLMPGLKTLHLPSQGRAGTTMDG